MSMQENVVSAPPEVQDEIQRGLDTLKKHGYQVTAQPNSSGELTIDFKFGATEQTLKFTKDEWSKAGTVEKRIVDKLEI
jgi:hypothetical protein